MSVGRNPYTILGLPSFATQREISAAYRRLARQFHPDLNPHRDASRRMQDINWAYGVLRDPAARQSFDHLQARRRRGRRAARRGASWASAQAAGPNAASINLMGETTDRAIVGSLVAVVALAITMLIGLEFLNWGAPLALAIGCWIAAVPNRRLSSQHGMAIGALIGLFAAAGLSFSLPNQGGSSSVLTGFLCCAPTTVLVGGSTGAMLGSLAGWIRQAGTLV